MKSSFLITGVALLGAALASGCGGGEPEPSSSASPQAQAAPAPSPLPPARSSLRSTVAAENAPAVVAEVGASGEDFAWQLYESVRGRRGNVFLGAHSVRSVLASLSQAAAGETGAELRRAGKLGDDPKELAGRWSAFRAQLTEPGRAGSVHSSGGGWLQSGHSFRPEFTDGLRASGLSLSSADFRGGLYEAGRVVSQWLQAQAGTWVTSWMPHPKENALSQVVFADALRVRASWRQPFANQERWGAFELSDGFRLGVPVMEQTSVLRHAEGENFEALELPTDREGLSVLLVIPASGALEEVESSIDRQWVSDVVHLLAPQNVHLTLPKFTSSVAAPLGASLVRLGIKSAFEEGSADFSAVDGGRTHYLGAVDHQAAVSFTERGLEVSSATVGQLDGRKEALGPGHSDPGFQVVALDPMTPKAVPPVLTSETTVSRPFLFVVRDGRTGSALFVARVSDPTA